MPFATEKVVHLLQLIMLLFMKLLLNTVVNYFYQGFMNTILKEL